MSGQVSTAEQHRILRVEIERERQRQRNTLTLGERLDRALVGAAQMANGATTSFADRISRGKAESAPPPNADEILYGSEGGSVLDVYGRRLRLIIESLEREVDGHALRPIGGGVESREEKDRRLIRDFEGDPSHLVALIDPSMGSPRTIERARVRMHRRASDGRSC
jgi:hypothetical protein